MYSNLCNKSTYTCVLINTERKAVVFFSLCQFHTLYRFFDSVSIQQQSVPPNAKKPLCFTGYESYNSLAEFFEKVPDLKSAMWLDAKGDDSVFFLAAKNIAIESARLMDACGSI